MDYLQYIESIKSIDDCQIYNFPNYPVDQMRKVFQKWLDYLTDVDQISVVQERINVCRKYEHYPHPISFMEACMIEGMIQ